MNPGIMRSPCTEICRSSSRHSTKDSLIYLTRFPPGISFLISFKNAPEVFFRKSSGGFFQKFLRGFPPGNPTGISIRNFYVDCIHQCLRGYWPENPFRMPKHSSVNFHLEFLRVFTTESIRGSAPKILHVFSLDIPPAIRSMHSSRNFLQ